MPGISVIVPVYQAEKFLKDCVESVVRQSYSDWELLLIDDGCTDGLLPSVTHVRRRTAVSGFFIRRRTPGSVRRGIPGLREARGQYIAFLDVDDRYETD